MRSFLPRLVLFLGLSLGLFVSQLSAQGCGIYKGVDFSAYGNGCPGAGSVAPVLLGSLDTQTCTVTLKLDKHQWWPNVYLKGWILGVGLQQVSVPFLRQGCTLLVNPLVLVAYDASMTTVPISLPNDPSLIGRSLYCQGALPYFGFYFGTDLTQGLSVTLR